MHDRERLVAVLVKTDNAIDVVEGFTRGRNDERQLRRGDFLGERPIREVAARDFEVIVTVLDDFIHGDVIPRRAHRKETVFDDGVFNAAVIVPTERGLGKPFHEFQIRAGAEIGVNEVRQVPVLELHREAEGKARTGLAQLAHDPDPMGDIAHVVVGHLKNKQRLGRHAVAHKILARPPRGQRCTQNRGSLGLKVGE